MASLQKNHWVWGFTLTVGASHHCLFQIQALSQSQLLHHMTQISWAPTICQALRESLSLCCGQKNSVPAPRRESESCSVVSDSLWPHGYTVFGVLQARMLGWVAIPFSRGTSNPGIEPWSPALQADSIPAELQGSRNLKSSGRGNY